MAGKLTTVHNTPEWKHGVKFVKVTFLADDADASVDTGTIPGVQGMQLHSVSVVNGTTGFTDVVTDLALVDDTSAHVLVSSTGNGVDVGGDSISHFKLAEDTTHCIHGSLTATVTSNAVNSATAVMTFAFVKIK